MKNQLDMLNGPIWSRLPRFALPVAATAVLEQLFNASDVAIVGNFTGDERTAAVAAVGANSPVISLIVNLFVGVALGANVVIANAIGRGDREAVRKAVHTSVVIAVIGGFFISIVGELTADIILRSLNVPDDVLPLALTYLRIYLLGMPVILLYNFEAAIFRSVGDTKIPLLALAVSGALNVLLNLFFVAVLHMTVDGVAIATVISNAISSVLLFLRLRKTTQPIHIEFRELRIDCGVLAKILKIGLPAGIQSAVFSVSNIVIQSAINSLGKVVMAASSAAYNIEIFAYDVLNSFSQACTTFVGQNYGAGQIKRCRRTLLLCLAEDAIASAAAIALVLFAGRFLLSIFNGEPEVVEIGYTRLSIIFTAYTFTMLYEVMSGYLRGFGFSLIPAILTMIGVCGVRIAWIQLVFSQNQTFSTIMYAYPLSLSATALLIFIVLLIYHPSKRFAALEQKKPAIDKKSL
ncbi:MAG TPA: MATE family efflux transporter [Ruminococcaceae bacterium]|nr:MATE family efflux transporter [Oscillospiraceae bacterium]